MNRVLWQYPTPKNDPFCCNAASDTKILGPSRGRSSSILQLAVHVENIRSGKRPHKLAQAKHFEEPKEWIFLLTKTVVDYKQVEIRIISKDILWNVFGLADPIVTIPTKRVRFVQYNNICSQSPNTQKTPDLQLFTLPFDFHIESQWRITQNTTIELVPEASQNKHRIYTKHIRRHLGPTGSARFDASRSWRYMLYCFCSKNSAPINFSVVSHWDNKYCGFNTPCCDTSSEKETASISI